MSVPASRIPPATTAHLTRIAELGHAIENTFAAFNVPISMQEVDLATDHITFFYAPTQPTRMMTIQDFEDDLRFALARDRVEIEAPVPNTRTFAVHIYLDVAKEIFNLAEPEGVLSPWTNVDDELFYKAVKLVTQYHKPYTSFLQARLNIGYQRATHLMELMEERGIITRRSDRNPGHSDDREDHL
jgi:hypothetical protein